MIFHYHNTPIHYQKHGSGPALVLLHGFLESSTMWKQIIPAFSKTHTIISIDLPGFGQSGTVAETHSMELMATITSEILSVEKVETATFIAHSMGGYVSLAFAEVFPEKIEKLILLNSTPAQDSKERKINRNRALDIIDKNKDVFVSMAIGNLFTTKERSQFKVEILSLKKEALQVSTEGIKATIRGLRDRKDKTAILEFLDCEKHIISGRLDPIVSHNEILTISKQTHTTLHTIESGHMSWLTNWEEIVKIVHFIE
jgi:pimeloyl-ACP methyl ester carboxylesterase